MVNSFTIEQSELLSFIASGINPQLACENNFGNMNRYTDLNGGQDYVNRQYVDHYTGLYFETKD
jgi:hypothetical protein